MQGTSPSSERQPYMITRLLGTREDRPGFLHSVYGCSAFGIVESTKSIRLFSHGHEAKLPVQVRGTSYCSHHPQAGGVGPEL
jgi:hypothetical protein